MSNNTNSSALPPPTTQGRFGSPSEDALRTMNQKNGLDALRANSVGGSKKKKGGAVTVSTVQPMYKEVGGPGQTTTGISTNNAKVANQNQQDAIYDNQLQQGGKRCKKGGNPDWLWGCYSGGKKRKTRTNKRKTRRYRKKTRRNKK
jgi:hypothetical protein